MATTDSKGILFYEDTDVVSPLHTLLNTGQQSVSDALNYATATTITLAAGWSTFGGGYIVPMWYKDISGFVHLEGILYRSGATITGAATGAIFTLPVGARPTGLARYPANKSGSFVAVNITAAGVVSVEDPLTWTSGADYLYLSNIVFRAA